MTGGISEICSLSEFATVGRHITEESGVATKVEAVSDDDPDPSDELSVSDVDDVGGARNWPFSASSPSESVPMPHNAARGPAQTQAFSTHLPPRRSRSARGTVGAHITPFSPSLALPRPPAFAFSFEVLSTPGSARP